MSLTIDTGSMGLNLLSIVGNSAIIGVKSDSYVGEAAVEGELVLYFDSSTYQADDILKLSFQGTEMEFTVKASPNDEGYELSEIFTDLEDDFLNNAIIEKYYDVVADNGANTITLTQKVASTSNEITFVGVTVATPGAIALNSSTDAVDFKYKDNYRMVMEVIESENGNVLGNVQSVLTDEFTPVDYGATFDGNFGNALYDLDEVEAFKALGFYLSYYLRMYEEWGVSPLPYNLIPKVRKEVNSVFVPAIAIDGGIDFFDFVDFDDSDYWSSLANEKKWWTAQYDGRKVFTDQRLYLHAIIGRPNLGTPEDYRLSVTLNYEDGTAHTFTKDEFEAEDNYNLWAIPCGYTQLDIESEATERVVSYSVELQMYFISDWYSITNAHTFKIQDTSFANKTEFVFKSSWGVLETAIFTGNTLREVQLNSEEFYGVKRWNYTNGNFGNMNMSSRTGFVFRSGYVSKQEKEYLLNLLNSDFVYFKDTDDKWKKLVLSSSIKDAVQLDDDIFTVEFEAKLANYD